MSLPVPLPWTSPLRELMRFDGGAASKNFMRSVRHYNSMFAFTSLRVHVGRTVNVGSGQYIFKICGTVHHKIGSLIPTVYRRPEFAQLYVYDTANELDNRMALFRRQAAQEDNIDGDLDSTQDGDHSVRPISTSRSLFHFRLGRLLSLTGRLLTP